MSRVPAAFLSLGLLITMGLQASAAGTRPDATRAIDKVLQETLQRYRIPGASLSVMRDGRLVYARGFGYADVEARKPVDPTTLFRIGSVSKPVTAMTVVKLVEQGRLRLDDKAFDILADLKPFPGMAPDPRLADVTVRQLLTHTGGWDPAQKGDPLADAADIAKSLGLTYPISTRTLIRYVMGQPLAFDPGARYSYSNIGYMILGLIIEAVTGQTYEDAVKTALLWPAGIRDMQLGRSLKEERALHETVYYPQPYETTMPAAFPGFGTVKGGAYGLFSIPLGLSSGGWVASSVDLLRFVRGIFGSGRLPALLSPQSRVLIAADPKVPGFLKPGEHYGFGWVIQPRTTPGPTWNHTGAITGSSTSHLEYRADGLAFAVIYNSMPEDVMGFHNERLPHIRRAIQGVATWPQPDLFATYR